ncbi:MAG: hypothetical protein NVS9B7_10870 [Flavisolibacter sp.]
MAKKDQGLKEEIDLNKEPENSEGGPLKKSDTKTRNTEVKNANAAGLGTMGRNDETELGAPKVGEDGKY